MLFSHKLHISGILSWENSLCLSIACFLKPVDWYCGKQASQCSVSVAPQRAAIEESSFIGRHASLLHTQGYVDTV